MYLLQLSRLVALPYRHDVHSRLADLNRLLRYSLGGKRPTQTTHQALSPLVFAEQVRTYLKPERYFTDDSRPSEGGPSKSPAYATQAKHTLNTKL